MNRIVRLGAALLITLALTTVTRADPGLTQLVNAAFIPRTESAELHEIAHQRAVEIASDFSHNGQREGTAEVLAWNENYPDPVARAVEQWLGSPGHAAILADPTFTQIGCGSHVAGNVHYFACVLTAGSVQQAPQPAPAPPTPSPEPAGEPIAVVRTPNPQPVGAIPTAGAPEQPEGPPSTVGRTPSALPDTAMAQPWKVAVLIFRSIDAHCLGRQVTGSLQQVEIDPAAMASRFDATIGSWSGVDHSVTVYEMGTLRSVTVGSSGNYCWPTPADMSLPAGFDSYVVLYDADADDPATGVNSFGGLSYNGLVNGIAWSTVTMPDGDEWWFPNNEYPELAAIHEFLHPVAGFYRATWGDQIPGVHDEWKYGLEGVEWHRALTGGDLADLNGDGMPDGLTPEVWGSGTPSSGASEPEPPAPSEKPCRNQQSNAKACR